MLSRTEAKLNFQGIMGLADEEKMWLILLILGHANIFLMDMAFRIFFCQGENKYLYWDYFKRGSMLTQLRVFNTSRKVWVIAFITNNGGEIPGRMFGTFTATEKAGEVIMEPPPTEYCQLKTNCIF